MDAQLSKYNIDIDLAVDRSSEKNKYYFISGKEVLNIPLEYEKLISVWNILLQLFSTDIQLVWDLYYRWIFEDTWKPDGFEKVLVESIHKNREFSKNEIEELFIFVMKSKGINIENWKIESSICKNNDPNNDCKLDLWNN